MFKNAIVYRMGPVLASVYINLEENLPKFVPCGQTQPVSAGWVPPRGIEHGALVESIGGHLLLKLQIETKAVPSEIVKRKLAEHSKAIEQSTGRKPGKKQLKELKEEVLLDLLPAAFPRRSAINVWINPGHGLVVIDTPSESKADDVATHLVRAIDGLVISPLRTVTSPSALMANWLDAGEPDPEFSIGRECELKAPDETKAVVRYGNHPLDIEEVVEHIEQGKVPTRLSLTWNGRVSFELRDSGALRKIDFLDIVFEGSVPAVDDHFDADAAIATGELSQLIASVIDALGGEVKVEEE